MKSQPISVHIQRPIHSIFLFTAAIMLLAFGSCKKNPVEPVPTPTPVAPKPGAIKGSIVPANAAVKIVCTPSGGSTSTDIIPSAGNFKLTGLSAGSYTLSVVPKLGYATPPAATVTVSAADTANAAAFNLTTNGQSTGYFRFTMDATPYYITVPNVSCTYASNVLTINATTTPTVPYWTFKINLDNVSAPATFNLTPLTSSSYVEAYSYLPTTVASFSTTILSTDPLVPRGSATIAITELNANTHVVAGTFTAVLLQRGLGNGVKRMTNGSFQLNY